VSDASNFLVGFDQRKNGIFWLLVGRMSDRGDRIQIPQVGSFGNNYNNRTEEALGSAVDLWAAYREGAFKPSRGPWFGLCDVALKRLPLPRAPSRHKSPF